MPVPAFGFSAGDLITIITLSWQICQALSETSKDLKILREIPTELSAFSNVVCQVKDLVETTTLSDISENERVVLQKTLSQAKVTIEDFGYYVESFKAGADGGGGATTGSVVKWKKRASWSLSGVKRVREFRESMQSYSSILSLALLRLNMNAIQAVDRQVVNQAKALSLQMQRNTDDVQLQISSSLDDPWDRKPVWFQDATGRRYPIPLEVCGTLAGLLDFLKHAFKNTPVETTVEQLAIWLFTPVLGQVKQWNLITAEDWEDHARPGMQLGMSLATFSIQDGFAQKGVFSCKIQDQINFETPLPAWAPYPEDAQFRYLPHKKPSQLIQLDEPPNSGDLKNEPPTPDRQSRIQAIDDPSRFLRCLRCGTPKPGQPICHSCKRLKK